MTLALDSGARQSIAIIACVKSTSRTPALNDTALARVLVPSLNATISEEERREWDIRLYLCADADDALYLTAAASGELRSFAPPWIDVRAFFYPQNKRGRIPSREVAAQAVADGCDYLHRTNDDIEYQRRGGVGWLTGTTGALRALSPPNIGVMGAKVWGDGLRYRGGFTIDLVHRTHLAIFGECVLLRSPSPYVHGIWLSSTFPHMAGTTRRSWTTGSSTTGSRTRTCRGTRRATRTARS